MPLLTFLPTARARTQDLRAMVGHPPPATRAVLEHRAYAPQKGAPLGPLICPCGLSLKGKTKVGSRETAPVVRQYIVQRFRMFVYMGTAFFPHFTFSCPVLRVVVSLMATYHIFEVTQRMPWCMVCLMERPQATRGTAQHLQIYGIGHGKGRRVESLPCRVHLRTSGARHPHTGAREVVQGHVGLPRSRVRVNGVERFAHGERLAVRRYDCRLQTKREGPAFTTRHRRNNAKEGTAWTTRARVCAGPHTMRDSVTGICCGSTETIGSRVRAEGGRTFRGPPPRDSMRKFVHTCILLALNSATSDGSKAASSRAESTTLVRAYNTAQNACGGVCFRFHKNHLQKAREVNLRGKCM